MYGPGDVRFFDRLSRLYDLLSPRARERPLREGLSVADRSVERLVDLGGGPGRAARAVAAEERIVVDAAPGMLWRARGHGLETVAGDATRLPLAAETVDAVLLVDALHHMPNPRLVIDECARVLRPGGALVIREFDPTTVPGRALVVAEALLGFGSRFVRPDRLAMTADAAGFDARVLDRGFAYTVAGRRRERSSDADEPVTG